MSKIIDVVEAEITLYKHAHYLNGKEIGYEWKDASGHMWVWFEDLTPVGEVA